jgi:rSAM/selenodomain-associated transferase 1
VTTVGRSDKPEAYLREGPHWDLRTVCAVAVMAKASIPGKMKTRLVPPLTEDEAASLNTAFLRDAADTILSATAFANISGWMAYAPAGTEMFFRTHLPDSIGLLETVAPSLGECLLHAAATLLRAGHGAACLLNSDSPTLPAGYLVAAATALAAPGDRIVLGPSTDGGYYLIGMKQPHPGLFEDIAWSTDQVFAQTLARAEALGLAVFELPTWYDVDDAESLQTLIDEVVVGKRFRDFGIPTAAKWTRNHLSILIEQRGLQGRILGSRVAGEVS